MSVTCAEMRGLEAVALAGGWTEEALMEAAGSGMARAVLELVAEPAAVVIFAGKGHNAGDAWVAARHWLAAGWRVVARPCFPEGEWRPLTLAQWRRVADQVETEIPAVGRLVVVDGLLGLGSGLGLRAPVSEACQEMNGLRESRHATVVAVDGPTGLDFDTGVVDASAVRADVTVTVASVKRGFLADGAVSHVGRLVVVPVAGLEPPAVPYRLEADDVLTPSRLRTHAPGPRPFDWHKGQAGRVLVVAGSRGYVGAARLASAAAVHAGAGLVTLAVPVGVQDVVAAATVEEVMVRGYREWAELVDVPANVLAVGPGVGRRDDAGLAAWLAAEGRPAVVDADALSGLAAMGAGEGPADAGVARSAVARPDRLLTPHPGEMARLLSAWGRSLLGAPRGGQARGLAQTLGATVLLKGSRSLIATPGWPLAHNTTGHPGMASGGMGDVLTGVCAALLAQGATPHEAGCLGSWLLGRAAEIALRRGEASPESLRASVVLDHLGAAFEALRFSEW